MDPPGRRDQRALNLTKEVLKAILDKGLDGVSPGKMALGARATESPAGRLAASKIDSYVLKQPTRTALDRLLTTIGADEDEAGFHLPAGCWDGPDDGGYDLSEGGRTQAEVIGDAVTLDGVDGSLYRPAATGTATIQVSTVSEAFGNEIFIERRDVEVKELGVDVDPPSDLVKPGDPLTFTARVINADDQRVSWSTSAGYFDLETTSVDGNNEAVLVTLTDPAEFPVRVTATSLTETGLRSGGDARTDTGLAVEAALDLLPVEECVAPGDEVQLRVELPDGGEDLELTWTFSAGDVDAGGLFRAPNEAGDVEVTVSVVGSPDVADTITIPVGGCTCRMSVTIGGEVPAVTSARFWLNETLDEVLFFEWGGTVGAGSVGFGPDPENPQTLSVDSTAAGDAFIEGHGFHTWDGLAYANPDGAGEGDPLTIFITANDGEVLEGSVAGQVFGGAGPTGSWYDFSMSFYVESDPMWSTDQERVCGLD